MGSIFLELSTAVLHKHGTGRRRWRVDGDHLLGLNAALLHMQGMGSRRCRFDKNILLELNAAALHKVQTRNGKVEVQG